MLVGRSVCWSVCRSATTLFFFTFYCPYPTDLGHWWPPVSSRFSQASPGIFLRLISVSPGFTRFHPVSPGFTQVHPVSPGFTRFQPGFNQVSTRFLPVSTGFHWFPPVSTRFQPGFTRFHPSFISVSLVETFSPEANVMKMG